MSIIEQGWFDNDKKNTVWSFEDAGRLVISGTDSTDFIWGSVIPWEKYSEKITEIYFAAGLVWISGEFENMPNLKKVEFADTVKDFNGKFKNCPNLNEIVIPDSMVQITDGAFEDTAWFKAQPDGMVYAGRVFYKYKGEFFGGEIRLKDGTTGIARGALRECKGITNIVIPESVSSFGSSDFTYDYHYKQMYIGVNWSLEYDGCLWLMCGKMRNFGSPAEQPWRNNRRHIKALRGHGIGPNNIGGYAFAECSGLETVKLTHATNIISTGAFQNCKKLREVTGLDGIQIIEKGAFSGCENLTEFAVPKLIKGISGQELVKYNEKHDIVFVPDKTLTAQSDPDSIVGGYGEDFTWTLDRFGTLTINGEGELNGGENFNSSEFAGTLSLEEGVKSLILDERITEIGWGKFENFKALTKVTLPPNLKLIGSEAFRGCKSLANIVFPNTLETICWCAFDGCASLEEIDIPESVRVIDYCAFSGCERLRRFTLPENTILREMVLENTAIEKACPTDIFYFNDWALGLKNNLKGDTVLKFKRGTRRICRLAFGSPDYPINDEIVGVVLDGDITYIGSEAFRTCKNLESVTADCTFTEVGDHAFGCTKWADNQSQGLVYLANALLGLKNNIGGYRKEDGLFEEEFVSVDEVHDGRRITLIANCAFRRADTIKEVTLPESIETIGSCAFYSCKNLQKINLPNSLKKIDNRAFYDCIALKEIYIPRSVEEIGENAFGYYESEDVFDFDPHRLEDFKIIGEKNSAAEKYALENGIEFEII